MDVHDISVSTPFKGPGNVFDGLGQPKFWLMKADEFKRASGVIYASLSEDERRFKEYVDAARSGRNKNVEWPPMPLFGVVIFLSGLSMENLLKGLYVKNNPRVISGGKMRGAVMTGHDLPLLANELGLELTGQQQQYLDLAKDSIVSEGRYPIPKNVGNLKVQKGVRRNSYQVFEELYKKVYSLFEPQDFGEIIVATGVLKVKPNPGKPRDR